MSPVENVANRLLKLEFQLRAYQKLHEEELAELWKALDECKQQIADSCHEGESSPVQFEPQPVNVELTEDNEDSKS